MILSGITRRLKAAYSFVVGKARGVLAWSYGMDALYPRLHGGKGITDAYAKVLPIYAIINKDAAKFAQIPRYVYDLKSLQDSKSRAAKLSGSKVDELMKLLKNPNPYQTESEFNEAVKIMYNSTGEAIVWLNRGDTRTADKDDQGNYVVNASGVIEWRERSAEERKKRPVLEMYVLPSDFVGIIPDPDNVFGIRGYWFETGDGRIKAIPKEDIIHWKRYNPLFDYSTADHLRGLSPAEVASCDIAELKAIAKSNLRMHENDGAKGILTHKGMSWDDLTEDQKARIQDTVYNKINSNDIKSTVQMLGGDWTYHDIGKKSVDLDSIKAKGLKWKEICFLYDMPYGFFENDGKYSNAPEWQRQWVSNSILPASQRWDAKLTTPLVEAFGLTGAVICGDSMVFPEMQRDLAALATALNNMWYVTPNEKRVLTGFEPHTDKRFNEPWVPFGAQPLSQWSAETEFQNQSGALADDEY